jgi:hypothetical protein
MNLPALPIFVAMTAMCAAAVFLLFAIVPQCLRSLFRYKLWAIRDEIFDAVMSGDLPNERIIRTFQRGVECMIRGSESITFTDFLFGTKAPQEWIKKTIKRTQDEIEALPDLARERFKEIEDSLDKAVTVHLLFGSPSGWIFTAIATIVILALAVPVGLYELIKKGSNALQSFGNQLNWLSDLILHCVGWRGIFLANAAESQHADPRQLPSLSMFAG